MELSQFQEGNAAAVPIFPTLTTAILPLEICTLNFLGRKIVHSSFTNLTYTVVFPI